MSKVTIQRVGGPDGPDDRCLRAWADLALALGQVQAEVVIRLVDTEESRRLNRDYRGKDKPTNVLSFPADVPEGLPPELASECPFGDLVICGEVVDAEAQQQCKPPEAHWAHMVIHGCLHLQGHDHQTDTDATQMEALERRLLAELNFPDPYE